MNGDGGKGTVAVRFEGGLGDHLLAMRVLPFIHRRYPAHDIVVYSDSGAHTTPMQVTAMSPYVTRVVPIRANSPERTVAALCPEDLAKLHSADVFIDAWGETMFADASVTLNVPMFEILACRPELLVPASATRAAATLLSKYQGARFIGLNLTTHGAVLLRCYRDRIMQVLTTLLDQPQVTMLNIFTSRYDFPHWPEPFRSQRRGQSLDDAELQRGLCAMSARIVPCADLPITTVAALLQNCCYFIGVDNGIKHLAWALGTPLTYFHVGRPRMRHVLRWMPDFHRMLPFDSSEDALTRLSDDVLAFIS